QARQLEQFFTECFRVLAPGGVLYVDHPNGACPIDFWQDDRPGRPRPHSPMERFNPTLHEVERLVAATSPGARVEALSAAGRFSFRRSTRHWYGVVLLRPLRWWFQLLRHRPAYRLLATGLNPYLV